MDRSHWDDVPLRQERREARKRNGRKMRVSGRSVLLLATLTGVSRRRLWRRKRDTRR